MHILVITGASGAGKTAAVRALEERELPGVRCFYFDSIGVPALEVMRREHGGGEQWQAWATREWLRKLDQLAPTVQVAVLDGQTRPSHVAAVAKTLVRGVHTVLLDCEQEERERRLQVGRRQPELVTNQMASWAAYLRGQADALLVDVIDTSQLSPPSVADLLVEAIGRLLGEQPGTSITR